MQRCGTKGALTGIFDAITDGCNPCGFLQLLETANMKRPNYALLCVFVQVSHGRASPLKVCLLTCVFVGLRIGWFASMPKQNTSSNSDFRPVLQFFEQTCINKK